MVSNTQPPTTLSTTPPLSAHSFNPCRRAIVSPLAWEDGPEYQTAWGRNFGVFYALVKEPECAVPVFHSPAHAQRMAPSVVCVECRPCHCLLACHSRGDRDSRQSWIRLCRGALPALYGWTGRTYLIARALGCAYSVLKHKVKNSALLQSCCRDISRTRQIACEVPCPTVRVDN